MSDLSEKIALVTGGSRGIGAAIVKRLARDGASVAFTYASSAAQADELVRATSAGARKCIAIQADAADPQAATRAVAETVRQFGALDIVVNSAGALAVGDIAQFPEEQFE